MPTLVIAAYHCEVAGVETESVDYQVRYFTSDDIDQVVIRLKEEAPATYKNPFGEEVRWVFKDTVATGLYPQLSDGAELIGFITGRSKGNNDLMDGSSCDAI